MNSQRFFRWTLLLVFLAGIFSLSPAVLAAPKREKPLVLTSPAFKKGKEIPVKYALSPEIPGGENLSIPLNWKVGKKVSKKVKSFAIVMIDLHPIAEKWVHLMAVNIPKDVRSIAEGALSPGHTPPAGTLLLNNTYEFAGYGGPAPPPDTGHHVYQITLYALKTDTLSVNASQPISEKAFKKLVRGKVVAKISLKGKFGFPAAPGLQSGATRRVEITSSGFSPASLTISAGDTVEFVNADAAVHWPASNMHPTHTEYPETGGCIGSAFDACKGLAQGESFSFTFNQKGAWRYHDHVNSSKTGTITVE